MTDLPVDSFKDAAPLLRQPFTPAAVKFKVQATWPKDNPDSALIVSYIDARLAVERLNKVCPHLWSDAYTPVDAKTMWCHLTVDGVTRSDVGEGEKKGLVSDALKRAAVKFGVGVSLYATTKIILSLKDGHLKSVTASGKKSLALTPKGEQRCRDIYAQWLKEHGSKAFGEPLDHGDVEDTVGDHEAGEDEIVSDSSNDAGQTDDKSAKRRTLADLLVKHFNKDADAIGEFIKEETGKDKTSELSIEEMDKLIKEMAA